MRHLVVKAFHEGRLSKLDWDVDSLIAGGYTSILQHLLIWNATKVAEKYVLLVLLGDSLRHYIELHASNFTEAVCYQLHSQ